MARRICISIVLATAVLATSPASSQSVQRLRRNEADCIAQYLGAHPDPRTRNTADRIAFVDACGRKAEAASTGGLGHEKACIAEFREARRVHKTDLTQQAYVTSCMEH